MTKSRNPSPKFEQLELFAEKPNRPTWENLPSETRQRIKRLISQLLADYLRVSDAKSDRKEVVNER